MLAAAGLGGNALGSHPADMTGMAFDHAPSLLGGPLSFTMPNLGTDFQPGSAVPPGITSVGGDDVSRNLPLTVQTLAADLPSGIQMRLRPCDLLFALKPDLTVNMSKAAIVDLAGVNGILRRAAFRAKARAGQEQVESAIGQALQRGGVAPSATNKRVYSDIMGNAAGSYDVVESDLEALTVESAVRCIRFLGVMCSDKSMPSSRERLIGWQWAGRTKFPSIVPHARHGDFIGLEYRIVKFSGSDRAVYDENCQAIPGQFVDEAVQIVVVNLGAKRAAPQFSGLSGSRGIGGSGGAVYNKLSGRTLVYYEGAENGDWSHDAALKLKRAGKASKSIADCRLESSYTELLGVVNVVPNPLLPSPAQMAQAHVSHTTYQSLAGRSSIQIHVLRNQIRL
jgi:hypothetical protein